MRVEMNNKDDHQVETNVKESDIEKEQIPSLENLDWRREKISVMDIELDRENPRLNMTKEATNRDIINELFKTAKIEDLIPSILEYGHLYPGENPIVIEEKSKYIVVEGNRRVCSLQCIINTELVPIEKRQRIKEMIESSNIDISSLAKIEVYVSPRRDDAQRIITARHTKYQILQWPYVTKWRRDYNSFIKYKTVEEVANHLVEDIKDIKKNLKNYSLLRYVWDMPCWDLYEREGLKRNDLEGSALEWHMSSLENILEIDFDKDYNIKSRLKDEKFNYVLEKFIRSLYLNGEPKVDTRVKTDAFKGILNLWMQEYENTHKNPTQGGHEEDNRSNIPKKEGDPNGRGSTTSLGSKEDKRKTKGKRPEIFFGSLNREIKVHDPRLIRLTYELSKNDMKDRPATGIILARALIESSLLFRIKQKNLTEKLKQENKGLSIEDIRMYKVVDFCIKHIEDLFLDHKKAEQSLRTVQSDHLRYMNSIVHSSWLDPTADKVAAIAGDSRELLRVILTDSP